MKYLNKDGLIYFTQKIKEFVNLHINNKTNPHGVTAEQVGAISTAEKGQVNGVASLDETGKVLTEQLPEISAGVQNLVDDANTGSLRNVGANTDVGEYATALGRETTATGYYSTALGRESQSISRYGHAQNRGTIAQGYCQTAIGKYNVAQGNITSNADSDYAFIIGNGQDDATRSNSMTVTWDGTLDVAKGITVGGQPLDTGAPIDSPTFTGTPTAPTPSTDTGIANKSYVDSIIPTSLPANGGDSDTVDGKHATDFADSQTKNMFFCDKDDPTKQVAFDISRLPTNTLRTITVPVIGSSTIMAFNNNSLTFTNKKFGANTGFVNADGTTPFTVDSTTLVTNLNADTVDGKQADGTLATTEKNNLVTAINEVAQSVSGITADSIGAIPMSQKAQPNGVASLDSTGKVPTAQLPDIKAGAQNIVDGNATGSIRGINAKSNYTMGSNAVALGTNTIASGGYSHAEGTNTTAKGSYSHAEGSGTTASGDCSHAEGVFTTAKGSYSHAEGYSTMASGDYSHAQNCYTIAQGHMQTAIGRYNIAQGVASTTATTDHAFIIGNGTSSTARSNALSVTWDGTLDVAKGITVGGKPLGGAEMVTGYYTKGAYPYVVNLGFKPRILILAHTKSISSSTPRNTLTVMQDSVTDSSGTVLAQLTSTGFQASSVYADYTHYIAYK